ncbi:MAG: hypothetical protein QOH93_585 [Chloroflexia bacterium]|jgi:hypothetical protein|nr:hypothetical protein [Chloroflexia bacterium]
MNWSTEVTVAMIGLASSILAVIAGASVSLITTHLNKRDQEQRRAEERQRWHADFRLPRQLDTLSTLYADAATLHYLLTTLPLSTEPASARRALYRPAYDAHAKYSQSRALAFIYLNQSGRALTENYGHSARLVISRHVTSPITDIMEDFDPALDDAFYKEGELFKELTEVLEKELAISTYQPSHPRK